MSRSNGRSEQDKKSQQQQPTRRRSFLNRVWQAVIRLLCIRKNNEASATDNNRQTANVNEITEKNTSTQLEVTSTTNHPVTRKQNTSIILSTCCITNAFSYSLEESPEQKKAGQKGMKTPSSSSFVAPDSTSSTISVSLSQTATPLPTSSSSSPSSSSTSSNSSSSNSSSSSSSSSSNLSRTGQITTALPVGKLDATAQHLNLMLPPIRLLDSSTVSPLATPVELGSGSFGRVNLMTSAVLGYHHLVAVKTAIMTYYNDPEDDWYQMCLEARVMEFLSDLSSFPKVYGVFREGNECRMVLEFVGNIQSHTSTTLLNVMKTRRPTITGLECIAMTSDVAKGLREMHTRGLLHNDVAVRNILICHNGIRFTAKLTDFGMVSSIKKPRRSEKVTFKSEAERDHYISTHPETPIEKIVHGARDSVQTDIFSLGFVIKVLGIAIGNIHMSGTGDACVRVNAGERPPLDYIISTLDLAADCERVTPVCKSIDTPLF